MDDTTIMLPTKASTYLSTLKILSRTIAHSVFRIQSFAANSSAVIQYLPQKKRGSFVPVLTPTFAATLLPFDLKQQTCVQITHPEDVQDPQSALQKSVLYFFRSTPSVNFLQWKAFTTQLQQLPRENQTFTTVLTRPQWFQRRTEPRTRFRASKFLQPSFQTSLHAAHFPIDCYRHLIERLEIQACHLLQAAVCTTEQIRDAGNLVWAPAGFNQLMWIIETMMQAIASLGEVHIMISIELIRNTRILTHMEYHITDPLRRINAHMTLTPFGSFPLAAHAGYTQQTLQHLRDILQIPTLSLPRLRRTPPYPSHRDGM